MDNNPLSILRAQVAQATPGEWKIWRSPAGEWTARTEYRDSLGLRFTAWPAVCSAGAQPNEANAALIVTAIAIVRRMVSDEGIEAARDAVLAKVPLGYGMTRDEAETYAVAALNALLSDSQP